MNPYDLRGPEFLGLYVLLLLLCQAAAALLRRTLSGPGGPAGPRLLDLQFVEVALLAGGPERAFDAAVARLAAAQALEVDATGRTLCPRGEARGASALERLVLERSGPPPGTSIPRVRAEVAPALRVPEARLVALGLRPAGRGASLAPAALQMTLAVFGFGKVLVGASRHRPVGFLVVLLVLTVGLGVAWLLAGPRRSRLGDAALAAIQHRNAGLRSAAGAGSADVGLSVALFGAAALAGTPLAQVALALRPRAGAGSSSDHGASGCSSSGCSGGGGCGGGGCGGCGS